MSISIPDDLPEGAGYFLNPDYAAAIVGTTHDDRVVYDYDRTV